MSIELSAAIYYPRTSPKSLAYRSTLSETSLQDHNGSILSGALCIHVRLGASADEDLVVLLADLTDAGRRTAGYETCGGAVWMAHEEHEDQDDDQRREEQDQI